MFLATTSTGSTTSNGSGQPFFKLCSTSRLQNYLLLFHYLPPPSMSSGARCAHSPTYHTGTLALSSAHPLIRFPLIRLSRLRHLRFQILLSALPLARCRQIPLPSCPRENSRPLQRTQKFPRKSLDYPLCLFLVKNKILSMNSTIFVIVAY